MEDSGTPFILKNPEPVVSDDKFYDKNVYRLSQLFLELYNKDVNGFKEKFENSFPGENFESYKAQHLSSYDYFPASPNPLLFEIPLLTEALGTKVDCYIMDKEGNFSLKEIGPEGGAKASFALALNAINPNSAHFLSNL